MKSGVPGNMFSVAIKSDTGGISATIYGKKNPAGSEIKKKRITQEAGRAGSVGALRADKIFERILHECKAAWMHEGCALRAFKTSGRAAIEG